MDIDALQFYIQTDRLVLFPFTKDSLSLFMEDRGLFEEKFGVKYDGEKIDGEAIARLKKISAAFSCAAENYLFFTEFLIVIKDSDLIIGSIDFKYAPKNGVTEVGYGLNPDREGRGYMTEALVAFLDLGKSLGVKAVLAETEKDNIRSQKLLARCGFDVVLDDGDLWWKKNLT